MSIEKMMEMLKLMKEFENGNNVSNSNIADHMIGKTVLIRTFSAGVHYGTLKDLDNHQNCILTNTKRIYKWEGACSLSQLAVDGANDNSMISILVPEIMLQRVIEIIPMTEKAINKLNGIKEWKK